MTFAGLSRYRPYLVAVLAVLVVTLVPARHRDHTAVSTETPAVSDAGSTSVDTGPAPAGGTTSTLVETEPAATAVASSGQTAGAASRTPVTPAKGSAVPVTAPTGAPAKAAAVADGSQYPGIRSAAALDHPRCDKATRNIRIPSVYAPECVAPWPAGADNGGSTAIGVSKDAIKIVFYGGQDSEGYNSVWKDYTQLYNAYTELWGRKVQLIFFKPSGTDEVSQRADAIKIATEIKPFMSLSVSDTAQRVYSGELAGRGVIAYESNLLWKDAQAQVPYRWGIRPDDRIQILHVAEYVGKRLKGKPARWAGDAASQAQPRAFGLLYPEAWDRSMFDQEIAKYGVALTDAITYKEGNTGGYQEQARTLIARLKEKRANNVIAFTDPVFTAILTREATSQLFFPEWTVTGYSRQDVTLYGRIYDQQQWSHAFGVGPTQPLVAPINKFEYFTLYEWHFGNPPAGASNNALANAAAGQAWFVFRQVFAGLQLAGPALTAKTFRDAMFKREPRGGTFCGCKTFIGESWGRHIGLPWDDYTAYDDAGETWWDPTRQGQDEIGVIGAGEYMRVDGGKRYNPGQWPTADPKAFDPNGAVDVYSEYPAGEAPPSYPRPATP